MEVAFQSVMFHTCYRGSMRFAGRGRPGIRILKESGPVEPLLAVQVWSAEVSRDIWWGWGRGGGKNWTHCHYGMTGLSNRIIRPVGAEQAITART